MNRKLKQGVKLGLGSTLIISMSLLTLANAEESEPAATPYRPTVSNPADLSEPGWLELEMGVQRIQGGSDLRRDSVPVLAKLAFTENWGILVGSELGISRTDMNNEMFNGNGDTTFLVKHRIPTATEGTAWGIEAGYKSPTAPDTIGSGKSDYIVNGIFSTTISENVVDVNLSATRLGVVADGEGEIQYGWAASLAHNLNDQWGVFGELSGIARNATASQSQLMAGATYNRSKRVVLDAGAAWGLTKASQDWTAFAGVTVLMGKLW
jgi:hypothetical protein